MVNTVALAAWWAAVGETDRTGAAADKRRSAIIGAARTRMERIAAGTI
jgi:hypothetical protein